MSRMVYQGVSVINGPLVVISGPGPSDMANSSGSGTVKGMNGRAGPRSLVCRSGPGLWWHGRPDSVGDGMRFTGSALRIPVSVPMLGQSRRDSVLGMGRQSIWMVNAGCQREPDQSLGRGLSPGLHQAGISAIDGMTTLIRGQKLPIFSGNGLPHNRLAAQITRQAKLRSADEEFTIVFCAMGIKHDVAQFFVRSFEESGVLDRVAMFLSLADDPTMDRLVTPRSALTLAEYLAFDCDMHVLVVMTDMTNYCEALREIAIAKGEIPSRKGYPGYLYSDLSTLYERAGRIHDSSGSITQVPILTMPSDDISHPVPDLTGYITEGQIVLDRELHGRSVYPPIAGLPSLSRLMKDGIGEGATREDHPALASQLFAAYSRVKDVRSLAAVIGEEELSTLDKQYLRFGEVFERNVLSQGEYEDRSIDETLDRGWQALAVLPRDELVRVSHEQIKRHLPDSAGGG